MYFKHHLRNTLILQVLNNLITTSKYFGIIKLKNNNLVIAPKLLTIITTFDKSKCTKGKHL